VAHSITTLLFKIIHGSLNEYIKPGIVFTNSEQGCVV